LNEIKVRGEKHDLSMTSKEKAIKRMERDIEALEAKVKALEEDKIASLNEIKVWGERHDLSMAAVTSKGEAIERMERDIEALEAKVKALEEDNANEVGQLAGQLDESKQLVRDAEAAVGVLGAEVAQLRSELCYKKHCVLMVAESKLEDERRQAVEQMKQVEARCSQLEGEMNSEIVMIKVENKKLTRRARVMDQQIQDQRSRTVSKIMGRLLHQCSWMAFSKWQHVTEESRKLRNVGAKVMGRWTGSVLGRAMETWQHRAEEQHRLRRAGDKVLMRWRNQVLFVSLLPYPLGDKIVLALHHPGIFFNVNMHVGVSYEVLFRLT
jgi:chromosome segregation ATPase